MSFIRIYRILLFTFVFTLSFTIIPSMPAFSIQETPEEIGVDTVKKVKDGVISEMAKQDLRRRLNQHLKQQKEDGIRIDKEFIGLESGFDGFSEDAMIDLTLRDVDVASILRIIAKEGGMNFVIDESVMGFISAELKNISLNEAMQTILTSEELEARVTNNTIFVASRPAMAKKGLNRRFIKTFKLNNSNAVYIASILRASVFNKGYKVKDPVAGTALQAIPASTDGVSRNEMSNGASSTGQSSLIDAKTIKGKVERLQPS